MKFDTATDQNKKKAVSPFETASFLMPSLVQKDSQETALSNTCNYHWNITKDLSNSRLDKATTTSIFLTNLLALSGVQPNNHLLLRNAYNQRIRGKRKVD